MSKSDCDRPISLPLPSRHERILSAIKCFDGWGYSRNDVQYPWAIPGVDLFVVPVTGAKGVTNCCCFVEAVVLRAYDVQEWGLERHNCSMLVDARRPYSTVEVLEDAGLTMATENAGRTGVPRWYAVQGWRGGLVDIPQCGGHTFLVEAWPGEAMVTMHEANVSTGVHSLSTTWRTINKRYPSNKIVRLRDT